MNDKFFDLKKEKQDRMINAALKVFALNGYAHASTDDIVKEAGISKGLLFHYFINKIGLYSFVYDYSVKFVVLELTTSVDRSINDYFGLHLQIENANNNVMKSYPYMIAFLNSVKNENVVEALNEVAEKRGTIEEKRHEYFAHANLTVLKDGTDTARMDEIISFVSEGLIHRMLREDEYHIDGYYKEIKKYIDELKRAAEK